MSVDECRILLGHLAEGKSDAEVERWRDELSSVANSMYDHLQAKLRAEREIAETVAEAGTVVSFPGFRFEIPTAEGIRQGTLEKIRWTAHTFNHGVDGRDEGGV